MNAYQRLMHEAHLRYQRAAHGAKRTFVECATKQEVVQAKQEHAQSPHSVHIETKVRLVAAKLNLSLAAQQHWCLNYYRYFCNHDRLYIEACARCKRKGLVAPR